MQELIKLLTSHYEIIVFLATGLLSLSSKFRKLVTDVIRSISLSNNFYNVYGDSPAKTIKEIYEAIQTAHDVLEIRQQISEKYLKIGVYICDLEGKCSWSNQYLNDMFGLDSEEMKGFGWLRSVSQRDRKRTHEEWLYAVREGIAYSCDYHVHNERDNKKLFVRTEAVSVIDDKNEKKCYVGYLYPILEEAIDENNQGH